MESDGEDLENIFEEYENTENNEADNAENNQVSNESSGVKVPAPKRIIKNPRLKFNAERLIGERGIPVLVEHFKNVKFKGAGHEKEDLDKILTKLEHWTHRLFPSMKFEDCLHQVEKLGKKRPVQTCLQKMRLNMPIQSSDFVKDDDEDNVQRVGDAEPIEEVDAFDRLIAESQDTVNPNTSSVENIFDTNFMHPSPVQTSYGIGQVLGAESGLSLTEQQRERMERNRMLAAERRKARLAALQQNSSEMQSVNEEIILSQKVTNTQDKSYASSIRNQENIPSSSCDLFTKFTSDELNVEETPPEFNNQDSENLGLDDLVDLVDEEESVSDGNPVILPNDVEKTVCSNPNEGDNISKTISVYFEQNINADVSDTTYSERLIDEETSKTVNEENLEMESLLDLVNENSEAVQSNSNSLCTESIKSVKDVHEENILLDPEEQSPMIY